MVRRDAVVEPLLLLRQVVVVAPRLPLAVFDVGVAAAVGHTTIAPMVLSLATRPIEHSGNRQSRPQLLRD